MERRIKKVIKIKEIKELNKGFILRTEKVNDFNFKAGQYLIMKINNKDYYFSIASSPKEEDLLFLIGNKRLLESLKNKKEIEIEGPFGDFDINNLKKNVVFIVMGTGIAPARSIIKTLSKNNKKDKNIILFYQERKKDYLAFIDELKQDNKIKIIPVLSKEENYEFKGYVQDYLSDFLNNIKDKKEDFSFVIIGSKEFIDSIKKLLKENGIKEEQIKTNY